MILCYRSQLRFNVERQSKCVESNSSRTCNHCLIVLSQPRTDVMRIVNNSRRITDKIAILGAAINSHGNERRAGTMRQMRRMMVFPRYAFTVRLEAEWEEKIDCAYSVLYKISKEIASIVGKVDRYRSEFSQNYAMSQSLYWTDDYPASKKKQDALVWSISSPNADRFSKFFHRQTQR